MSAAKYVKTVEEVGELIPRQRGGSIGVKARYAQEWLKNHKIKKTALGWPVMKILAAARQDEADERPNDELDADIKRRRIKLLDIEIGKLEESLISRAEHNNRLVTMLNLCLGIMDQWIDNITAKRADAELRDELRKCKAAVLTAIQAERPIEPQKN